VNWSSPTTFREDLGSLGAAGFDLWFDGTYVHLAYVVGTTIYYRRGTPNADGTVTSSAEQTVVANVEGVTSLCVDSDGCPWIGYAGPRVPEPRYPSFVTKSSTSDGTWATQAAFPYALNRPLAYPRVVPLTGGMVYVVCGGHPLEAYTPFTYGRLWDGAAWGNEENPTARRGATGWARSIVAEGDDLHFVFQEAGTDLIYYVKRTYGVGWGSETILASGAFRSYPVLSIDDANNLYCFWAGAPMADYIYYLKYESGAWKPGVRWINETAEGMTRNSSLSGFYKEYGDYIGLVYLTGGYNVKFDKITLPPGAVPTPEPTPIVNTLISSGSRHTAGPEAGAIGTNQSFKQSRIVRHITYVPVVLVRA